MRSAQGMQSARPIGSPQAKRSAQAIGSPQAIRSAQAMRPVQVMGSAQIAGPLQAMRSPQVMRTAHVIGSPQVTRLAQVIGSANVIRTPQAMRSAKVIRSAQLMGRATARCHLSSSRARKRTTRGPELANAATSPPAHVGNLSACATRLCPWVGRRATQWSLVPDPRACEAREAGRASCRLRERGAACRCAMCAGRLLAFLTWRGGMPAATQSKQPTYRCRGVFGERPHDAQATPPPTPNLDSKSKAEGTSPCDAPARFGEFAPGFIARSSCMPVYLPARLPPPACLAANWLPLTACMHVCLLHACLVTYKPIAHHGHERWPSAKARGQPSPSASPFDSLRRVDLHRDRGNSCSSSQSCLHRMPSQP